MFLNIQIIEEIKDMKKNNKGFSLVELIVVILIMAIVAVALAPQVMKWVENSRIATDMQTRAELESACKRGMTSEEAFQNVINGGYRIEIEVDNSGNKKVTCIGGSDIDSDAFWKNFFKEYNVKDYADFKKTVELKSSPRSGNKVEMIVYVYQGGHTFSILKGFNSEDFDIS